MQRWLACLLLGCVLVTLATGFADAGDAPVLDRIVERGQIKVGMSGTQPPFNVVAKDGELIGLDVDLATLIAAAIDVEIEIVRKPFKELLDALEQGQVDMVMSGLTITAERNTRFAFVRPYTVSGKSILTRQDRIESLGSLEKMNRPEVRLAAMAGSTGEEIVRELIPDAKLYKTEAYDAAIRLILDDQVDALVADMPICVISALRHPEANLTTLTEPFTIEPIGIAVPPNDPLFLNLLDNYLDALEMQGVLEVLRARWFEDGSWMIRVP